MGTSTQALAELMASFGAKLKISAKTALYFTEIGVGYRLTDV
jgi:hypothetical protein